MTENSGDGSGNDKATSNDTQTSSSSDDAFAVWYGSKHGFRKTNERLRSLLIHPLGIPLAILLNETRRKRGNMN